jgi:hypothetical protein
MGIYELLILGLIILAAAAFAVFMSYKEVSKHQ